MVAGDLGQSLISVQAKHYGLTTCSYPPIASHHPVSIKPALNSAPTQTTYVELSHQIERDVERFVEINEVSARCEEHEAIW